MILDSFSYLYCLCYPFLKIKLGKSVVVVFLRMLFSQIWLLMFIAHLFQFLVSLVLFCHMVSDTFNENAPPTDDPTYISSLGAAVFEAMIQGDKNAVWLMQVCSFSSFFLILGPPVSLSEKVISVLEKVWLEMQIMAC